SLAHHYRFQYLCNYRAYATGGNHKHSRSSLGADSGENTNDWYPKSSRCRQLDDPKNLFAQCVLPYPERPVLRKPYRNRVAVASKIFRNHPSESGELLRNSSSGLYELGLHSVTQCRNRNRFAISTNHPVLYHHQYFTYQSDSIRIVLLYRIQHSIHLRKSEITQSIVLRIGLVNQISSHGSNRDWERPTSVCRVKQHSHIVVIAR